MSKKTTYIHAENNNKILSSNEVRLYVPPEPEKMKVLIWGKELCNMAEWNDFLKCVEEKTEENNQLKQQLEEKDEQIKKRVMVYEKQFIEQTDEIYSLKQQLAEKQNAIDEINKEFVQAVHDWKALCAEKDKEIEKLNKTLEMCKHIERYDIGEMFLENAKLIIEKRQFAIQKLEKVKINLKDRITMMGNKEHSYLQKVVSWIDVCDQINNQIKELKGE